MPFKSEKQRAFLYAKHPEVAKEFEAHTSEEEEKSLPEYAAKDKNGLKEYTKKHRRKKK